MNYTLITGASNGIGKEMAIRCAQLKMNLLLVCLPNENVGDLSKELRAKHIIETDFYECNLTDTGVPEGIINWIKEKGYNVNFLINNAGASWGEPYADYSEKGWDKVMDLNVKSIFYLTQKLTPMLAMKASNKDPARVINIGSIDGLNVPALESYAYGTSKAAVHHLTRVLAKKLVGDNILVNAIAPGPYESMMLGAAVNHDYSLIESRNPRKRIGSPEDMAGLVIFLCSRAGAYTVGAVIPSDGGLVGTAGHDLSQS